MGKKLGWVIGLGVVGLCLVWTVVTAASMGSEASSLDGMLKTALSNKEPEANVLKKVSDLGFEMSPAPDSSGKGPAHWAVIYKTWFTLKLGAREDGTLNSYHLDREGEVF